MFVLLRFQAKFNRGSTANMAAHQPGGLIPLIHPVFLGQKLSLGIPEGDPAVRCDDKLDPSILHTKRSIFLRYDLTVRGLRREERPVLIADLSHGSADADRIWAIRFDTKKFIFQAADDGMILNSYHRDLFSFLFFLLEHIESY